MRRNKKSGINKERIIMLASSAFVLAALTMTGVYMKGQNVESRDDGYTLDFTALPNNADDKLQEITENNDEHLLKEDENIPGLTEIIQREMRSRELLSPRMIWIICPRR